MGAALGCPSTRRKMSKMLEPVELEHLEALVEAADKLVEEEEEEPESESELPSSEEEEGEVEVVTF
jgi:hypothetical protein